MEAADCWRCLMECLGGETKAEQVVCEDEWSVEGWLGSRTAAPVARALMRPLLQRLREQVPEAFGSTVDDIVCPVSMSSAAAMTYLQWLGSRRERVRALLDERLLEHLTSIVCEAITELAPRESEDANGFVPPKLSDSTTLLPLGQFAGSVRQGCCSMAKEPMVQPRVGTLREVMAREHCQATDSSHLFTSPDYRVTTKSEYEWWYVVDPLHGLKQCGLKCWPVESAPLPHYHQRQAGSDPAPLSFFKGKMPSINRKLRSVGSSPLTEEEMIACRLYTGPMSHKYNAAVRARVGASALSKREATVLCGDNMYSATVRALTSGIAKLSRIMAVGSVYRGITDADLAQHLRTANEFGIRGVFEAGFLSATSRREIRAPGGNPSGACAVLQLEQGVLCRGADLSWLSMYPHEMEVVFAPCTGFEMRGTRVEGSLVVAEARLVELISSDDTATEEPDSAEAPIFVQV